MYSTASPIESNEPGPGPVPFPVLCRQPLRRSEALARVFLYGPDSLVLCSPFQRWTRRREQPLSSMSSASEESGPPEATGVLPMT